MTDPVDQLKQQYGGASSTTSAPQRTATSTSGPVISGSNLPAFSISRDLAAVPVLWDRGSTYFTENTSTREERGLPRGQGVMSTTTPGASMTMLDSLQRFYQWDPDSLSALQAALYNHGFFGKGDRKWSNFGSPDETSFKAWQRALTRAARSGQTIWEVLGAKNQADFTANAQDQFNAAVKAIGSAAAGGGGGSRRAPLQIRYSNPDDLKAIATKAAQETLGYVPDKDFLDQFVKVYHGVEGGAQRAAYGGGNFTDPGSPEVLAQKKAREKYRNAAQAHDVAGQFADFLQIIGAQG